MSELTLFENMPPEFKELLGQLDIDTTAAGRQGKAINRLSIRGAVFRKVVNGQEMGEIKERAMNVVIVKSAPISRMYYEGEYVQGQNNPPTCWSSDTNTGRHSDEVAPENVQSQSCFDCKQNIKGSGAGEGRACRFQQRVALLLADSEGKIASSELYQLSLPATSVFVLEDDKNDKQKMGLQAYARFLNSQTKPVPLASLVTEIRFDTDSSTPKLCFKPIRVLEQDELALAVEAQRNPETEKFITLSIKPKEDSGTPQLTNYKVDTPKPLFEELETPEEKPTAEVKEEELVEEPKVKPTKKNTPETIASGDVDLASLLDEFDDK